ncbi:MAG: hypothetical protein Q7J69_03930 [Candidatus Omnitrophota bacterium]|nr:hypothetical protein [Candidatus Omnitrophota bacterium]
MNRSIQKEVDLLHTPPNTTMFIMGSFSNGLAVHSETKGASSDLEAFIVSADENAVYRPKTLEQALERLGWIVNPLIVPNPIQPDILIQQVGQLHQFGFLVQLLWGRITISNKNLNEFFQDLRSSYNTPDYRKAAVARITPLLFARPVRGTRHVDLLEWGLRDVFQDPDLQSAIRKYFAWSLQGRPAALGEEDNLEMALRETQKSLYSALRFLAISPPGSRVPVIRPPLLEDEDPFGSLLQEFSAIQTFGAPLLDSGDLQAIRRLQETVLIHRVDFEAPLTLADLRDDYPRLLGILDKVVAALKEEAPNAAPPEPVEEQPARSGLEESKAEQLDKIREEVLVFVKQQYEGQILSRSFDAVRIGMDPNWYLDVRTTIAFGTLRLDLIPNRKNIFTDPSSELVQAQADIFQWLRGVSRPSPEWVDSGYWRIFPQKGITDTTSYRWVFDEEPAEVTQRMQSGLEESLGGQDEIRERAMEAFLRRERVREWHLKRIGAGQVRSRLETQERESAAAASQGGSGGSGPLTPAFPDFKFDKRRWAQIVGEKAGELFEQGVVRIPMGKGEMILLLRGGREVTTMMIDLLVRPDLEKRQHLYLGRFDLNFGLNGGYWATTARVYDKEKFDRIEAAAYLTDNNIEQTGPFSFFEESRSIDGEKGESFQALYVDRDAAWNLGMEMDSVRDILALTAVEVTRYRRFSVFGADLRHPLSSNSYFPGLGVKSVKGDNLYPNIEWYPLEELRWALRERLLGRFRLNGQEWLSQMEDQAGRLRNQRKIEVSLEGGRAVLLLRVPKGRAALDLFLARDGELPRFAGRMDLTSREGYYTATGAVLDAGSFSTEQTLFLEANGINPALSGPISRSRSERAHQALWLDEKLLQEVRLEPSLVRDALIFSMLEVLVNANISRWAVDSLFSNDNLVYSRFSRQPVSGNKNIFEINLDDTQKALQKALIQSSIHLDPRNWIELVEDEGWKLYVDGFLEIPIQGGDIVLFFRKSRDDQTLMFDMMLRQKYRGTHVHLGSLDLVRDKAIRAYVARGPGSWVPFSGTAEEYLESKRIPPTSESGLFEVFRNDRRNHSALLLNLAVLDQGGLRSEIIQDALLFAALDVLQSMKKPGFGVHSHSRYDNGDLLFLSVPPSRYPTSDGGEILLYDRSLLKKQVADRLNKSSAGLEELEAAARRVERALKALLDHEHRGVLRWQVIGPSMVNRYPFLSALNQTRHLFAIDPGGDQTEGVVRALPDQTEILRAGVDYYGNPDDVTNFLKYTARHGISFRENHRLVVNPNPAELLRQILSNMTDLTTYAVERRLKDLVGVSLEQLEQDLKLLGEV